MALIDHITISAKAGQGGDGVTRWLHIKGKDKGGPAGGDGGKGGDIIFEGVRDIGALAEYRYAKEFAGEDGHAGDNNNKHGKDGQQTVLKVPVGSILHNLATGEKIEVLEEGVPITYLKGGQGGYGNAHFKSSTNQNPMLARKGKKGEAVDIEITLKLIADAGLIGYPNAGKSSLLNELTRAHSKVGAYAFTTLDPNLGSFHGFVLADIPGLIEGSAEGRGLGIKFLQHIERTKLLIHLVSAEREDVVEAYSAIRSELEAYSSDLKDKQEIVLLTKVDILEDKELIESRLRDLQAVSGAPVYGVSVLDPESLKAFESSLSRALQEI